MLTIVSDAYAPSLIQLTLFLWAIALYVGGSNGIVAESHGDRVLESEHEEMDQHIIDFIKNKTSLE